MLMLLNRLTKREFFKLVLGAIATGTVCSSPALAAAIEQVEPNPIAEVVLKARRIVAFKQQYQVNMADPALAQWRQENDGLFDDLIGYAVAHFRAETATIDELRLLLKDRQALGIKGDLLDEAELRRLTEGLVPVAVMRELIAVHHVKFRLQHLPSWPQFVANYRDLILAA
jgi:hypothetical protein